MANNHADNSAPILSQSVRWGENYVSHALNKKLSGLIAPGVYKGFYIKPAPAPMRVLIDHAEGDSESVAVVERDGYSITVSMTGAGYVEIPAAGEWWICLEAFYSPGGQGYQRIVARAEREPHHVALGKASVLEDAVDLPIPAESISAESREWREPLGDLSPEIKRYVFDRADSQEANMVAISAQMIRLSSRVARLEMGGAGGPGGLDPAGVRIGDGKIAAPVTLVDEGAGDVPGAAISFTVESGAA